MGTSVGGGDHLRRKTTVLLGNGNRGKTAFPVISIRATPQSTQLFRQIGIEVTKLKQPITEAVLQRVQVE